MGWHELRIDLPRAHTERVGGALFELGTSGIQEDHRPGEAPPPRQPWDHGPDPEPSERLILRAWFEDPDRDELTARLLADLGDVSEACALRWVEVDEGDWAESWKQHFPVLEVSDRITVCPPWDVVPGGIVIEPGQGFGTGQHPTTRAALQAIDDLAEEVHSVLDVGCGSGILAIAAARLGLQASGIDVDPVAVADAEQNAARNGVTVAFSTTPVHKAGRADLVVANLHAELIERMAPFLVRATRRWLVLAGILVDREATVRVLFDDVFTLVTRDVDGEWVCLHYRNPR